MYAYIHIYMYIYIYIYIHIYIYIYIYISFVGGGIAHRLSGLWSPWLLRGSRWASRGQAPHGRVPFKASTLVGG